MTSSRPSPGIVALIVLVAAAVIAGFLVIDSPSQARLRLIDGRRVDDLQHASGSINHHWRTTRRLPEALSQLTQPPDADARYRDPTTNEAYEYRTTGERTYDLCAVFSRPSDGESYRAPAGFVWAHPAGRHCFHFTAPDR